MAQRQTKVTMKDLDNDPVTVEWGGDQTYAKLSADPYAALDVDRLNELIQTLEEARDWLVEVPE